MEPPAVCLFLFLEGEWQALEKRANQSSPEYLMRRWVIFLLLGTLK
jgi:hypothetical protein